ncbi:hypothetical protein DFQ11_101932 [Winogradskyella epiphytica]|uniref:Uncharacterized protein n=1 Tax=Winogradskyella epiphytica TaxID=262005 RepID=A0A2V4X0S1_9FLAO|nr:hypothetical protein [Winogradskyella epiphytica]PYE83496.1 hypothetical protein DFQ11_101932 [Winogradskyella epiphytica]GGW58601.1 hypothetical protein GCM10008085_07890 [Winogradskyella epiphytica]
METANIDFIRGVYEKTSSNKDGTRIDFKRITPVTQNNTLLTDIARLELDNGFHDRSRFFEYWIYFKSDAWVRSSKTGLANSNITNIFYGDIPRTLNLITKTNKGKDFENPQHLIFVYGSDIKKKFVVDIFKDFYITDKTLLLLFLRDHYIKHIYTKKNRL